MSLFGDEPTDSPPLNSSLTSKSLFGEQVTPAATSSSSLFADDGGDASPWDLPTPKKAARKNLVKNLLPAAEVPESYIDAFDTILNSNDKAGSGVGLTGVKNVLSSSSISPGDQETILNLVIPGGQEPATGLGRSEFNVLLALVGLAQEGDEVTLDGVDDRRRSA
jgi:sorting nexin-8